MKFTKKNRYIYGMMKTSTPLALLLPLILLSTAAFSLGAQTPYMDAMYIDVRWDRTDTLGEATMRLEYRMRFPSETGPDSQANTFHRHPQDHYARSGTPYSPPPAASPPTTSSGPGAIYSRCS